MQHPVSSQRRSSRPSIHLCIRTKTLNSINLGPYSPVGFPRYRVPSLCSTQGPAPRAQYHSGTGFQKAVPGPFCILLIAQGSNLSVSGAPKLNLEMQNAPL